MPRKPPRFDSLSPHGVRLAIVKKLVTPAALAVKGAWGRELSILKRLQAKYNSDDFWLWLSPAELLDSLAYFLGAYGSESLREHWNLYLFHRAQELAAQEDAAGRASTRSYLASTSMPDRLEDKPKRRENAITWADSPAVEDPL